MAPRSRAPRHTAGSRICRLCWHTAPTGVEMFIVVGMAETPLLICPRCADTVLQLAPSGEHLNREQEEMPGQLTMNL